MLLVLLLSVYVNLVKELFLLALFPSVSDTVFSESECKGTAFSRHGKIFHGLFSEKDAFSRFG